MLLWKGNTNIVIICPSCWVSPAHSGCIDNIFQQAGCSIPSLLGSVLNGWNICWHTTSGWINPTSLSSYFKKLCVGSGSMGIFVGKYEISVFWIFFLNQATSKLNDKFMSLLVNVLQISNNFLWLVCCMHLSFYWGPRFPLLQQRIT